MAKPFFLLSTVHPNTILGKSHWQIREMNPFIKTNEQLAGTILSGIDHLLFNQWTDHIVGCGLQISHNYLCYSLHVLPSDAF